MCHYCDVCKVNRHCVKCCPEKFDVRKFYCSKCNKQGVHPSGCCPNGPLKYMEQKFQQKQHLRFKHDSDEDKPEYDMDDEIDPNAALMMQSRETLENLEQKSIQQRNYLINTSLTSTFNSIMERPENIKGYEKFLRALSDPKDEDLRFMYENGLCQVKMKLRFFEVIGQLHQRDEMHRIMRLMDAIGSLYFDFNN